jgi:glycosyltransferase involved in cell wall biosynthesis
MHLIYNPLPSISFLESGGHDFGYFGGPSRMKGFDVLYRAILRVRNSRIRVHATKFPESEQSCFRPLNGQFLFYDRVPSPLLEKIWKKVRAIVVPSVWQEPLPYIVSEALLHGRLVIASKIGGIPEQLEGTEGNLLCDPGNYQQFANSMDFVSELGEERIADEGWHNREIFLSRFDNKTIIKEFVSVCDKVV